MSIVPKQERGSTPQPDFDETNRQMSEAFSRISMIQDRVAGIAEEMAEGGSQESIVNHGQLIRQMNLQLDYFAGEFEKRMAEPRFLLEFGRRCFEEALGGVARIRGEMRDLYGNVSREAVVAGAMVGVPANPVIANFIHQLYIYVDILRKYGPFEIMPKRLFNILKKHRCGADTLNFLDEANDHFKEVSDSMGHVPVVMMLGIRGLFLEIGKFAVEYNIDLSDSETVPAVDLDEDVEAFVSNCTEFLKRKQNYVLTRQNDSCHQMPLRSTDEFRMTAFIKALVDLKVFTLYNPAAKKS